MPDPVYQHFIYLFICLFVCLFVYSLAGEGMFLIWAPAGGTDCPCQWIKTRKVSPRTAAHQDDSCQDVTLVSGSISVLNVLYNP